MKKNKNGYVIVGYLFILLGISLPLYGFFSMSYRNLTQNKKYEAFKEKESVSRAEEEGARAYNAKISDNYLVDPFTNEDYSAQYEFYKKNPDKIFAYLEIPKLGLKKPVYLDASAKHLAMGLAHVDGTSLPLGGINRRSVIAGHRGGYGDLMFYNLHKLEEGDPIYLYRGGESLEYRVRDKEIILPSQWDKLQPRPGEDMITLLTCDPLRPPRPRRLLVNTVRVDPQLKTEGEKVQAKKEDQGPDKDVKKTNTLIYGITLVGLALLVLTLLKFIKYLRS